MNEKLQTIATLIDNCFIKQTNRHIPIFKLTDEELNKVHLITTINEKLALLKDRQFVDYKTFLTSNNNIDLHMNESLSPAFKEKFQLNCFRTFMTLSKNDNYKLLVLKTKNETKCYFVDTEDEKTVHIHFYIVLK